MSWLPDATRPRPAYLVDGVEPYRYSPDWDVYSGEILAGQPVVAEAFARLPPDPTLEYLLFSLGICTRDGREWALTFGDEALIFFDLSRPGTDIFEETLPPRRCRDGRACRPRSIRLHHHRAAHGGHRPGQNARHLRRCLPPPERLNQRAGCDVVPRRERCGTSRDRRYSLVRPRGFDDDAAMATSRRADMFTADGKPSDDDPREHGPHLGDERTTLVESLRRQRLTLELKCAGLDAEAMARRCRRALDHVAARAGAPPGRGRARDVSRAARRAGRAEAVHVRGRPRRRFQRRRRRPEVVAEAWASWRAEVAFADAIRGGRARLSTSPSTIPRTSTAAAAVPCRCASCWSA